jgi:hypothetical protein
LLALVQMPAGSVMRLPDEWEKYRRADVTERLKM